MRDGDLMSGEVDITKNAHAIEWLKSEIIVNTGALFRALIKTNREAILDALASLVMCIYVLAKRVGISHTQLQRRVEETLEINIREQHELERWYGDLSELRENLKR